METYKEIIKQSSEKMAKNCWLFLTNDKLPNKAIIKKEAFLHEVAAMIESAIQFNKKHTNPKP